MPDEVLALETARWGGAFAPGRVWPGECTAVAPSMRPRHAADVAAGLRTAGDVAAALAEVGGLINWGAEQSAFHPQQAVRCWDTATATLDGIRLAKKRAAADAGKGKGKGAGMAGRVFDAAEGELAEYAQVRP